MQILTNKDGHIIAYGTFPTETDNVIQLPAAQAEALHEPGTKTWDGSSINVQAPASAYALPPAPPDATRAARIQAVQQIAQFLPEIAPAVAVLAGVTTEELSQAPQG
jgi:hypothetical protein